MEHLVLEEALFIAVAVRFMGLEAVVAVVIGIVITSVPMVRMEEDRNRIRLAEVAGLVRLHLGLVRLELATRRTKEGMVAQAAAVAGQEILRAMEAQEELVVFQAAAVVEEERQP